MTQSSLNFREATLDDALAIAKLHAKSWQKSYVGILDQQYLDNEVVGERIALWQQRLSHPTDNQWVMLVEETEDVKGVGGENTSYSSASQNQLLGLICLYGNQHREFGTIVDNLHISEQCKGQGIGRALMERAHNWAHQHYPSLPLYLEVLSDNHAAIAFYEKLGGEKRKTAIWQSPCGSAVEETVYCWQLASH